VFSKNGATVLKVQGQDSQSYYLRQIHKIVSTLGLKILNFFKTKSGF